MFSDSRLSERIISPNSTLLEALRRMDETYKKLLLVLNDDQFIGLISAGDIQRAIIRNIPLDTALVEIIRPNIKFSDIDTSIEEIRAQMLEYRMELMPVISHDKKLIRVHFWEDIFGTAPIDTRPKLHADVVIMAGGLGTRMKPITNVIPKPLIPIGDKPIIEHIIDRFNKIGCNNFYLTVNYKADLIKYYFQTTSHQPCKIEFIQESKPLGTAGSLKLLEGILNDTFFVTNCDILIDQDYRDLWDFHKDQKNELTLVSSLKNIYIPYGTVKVGDQGQLLEINEKPTISYFVNSGMYILEPHLLAEIPQDSLSNITDLIDGILSRKGKVAVYPTSEGSLIDIGNWEEYLRYVERW